MNRLYSYKKRKTEIGNDDRSIAVYEAETKQKKRRGGEFRK